MTYLASSNNAIPAQATRLPATGATTTLTLTNASTSYATAALTPGLYRVVCSSPASICAGATAALTDMPMVADAPEYFEVLASNGSNQTVAGISTYAGATIKLTLMP